MVIECWPSAALLSAHIFTVDDTVCPGAIVLPVGLNETVIPAGVEATP